MIEMIIVGTLTGIVISYITRKWMRKESLKSQAMTYMFCQSFLLEKLKKGEFINVYNTSLEMHVEWLKTKKAEDIYLMITNFERSNS